MDQPAPLPAAGFYPDPDVPGQHRFWDGNRWYASIPAYGRPQLGAGFPALAVVVGALLAVQVVLALVTVLVQYWGATAVTDELRRGDGSHADLYDGLDVGLTLLSVGLLLVTAVPWCMWQYRLARAADPDKVRRGPGMHAGSWFIPVVALWFPVQNMRDLWLSFRVSPSRALLGWWWTFWILEIVTGRAVANLADDIDSPEAFRTYALANVVDSAMVVVAGSLALLVVRRLTAAARTREAGWLAG